MMKSRHRSSKAVLRLPDLEHAKSAVLNSLALPESRRSYEICDPKLRSVGTAQNPASPQTEIWRLRHLKTSGRIRLSTLPRIGSMLPNLSSGGLRVLPRAAPLPVTL